MKYEKFIKLWIEKTLNEEEKEIFYQGLINTTYFIQEVEEI